MKNERKVRFGEGILFAALLMLCVTAVIVAGMLNRPEKEIIHSIHVLPEGFEAKAKTDINSASAAELDELPGVGEVLAQRIIEYREANGAFACAEDIMLVDGIGESLFAGLEDMIAAYPQ